MGSDWSAPTSAHRSSPRTTRTASASATSVPVITKIPSTEDSLKMWDALMDMMDVDGFFELKKTRTDGPDPGDRPDPI